MTFTNSGDGTYKVTYNTAGTLSLTASSVYLKGTFNNWSEADAFTKTANGDIISVTKELAAGSYEFKIHKFGTDEWYGKDETIADVPIQYELINKKEPRRMRIVFRGSLFYGRKYLIYSGDRRPALRGRADRRCRSISISARQSSAICRRVTGVSSL